MIEGQDENNYSNSPLSVEGQQTKAVLALTCMAVFFIHLVPDALLHCFFF
jgi:hypothetical protein